MNASNSSVERMFLFLVQAVIGFTWFESGIEKLFGSHGFDGGARFAGSMAGTLGFFASKNPHSWYQDFLQSVAIPHSGAFGDLIAYGETLTGVALLATSAVLLARSAGTLSRSARLASVAALLAAAAMNANYWLASGWISIADDRINVLMAMVELTLAAAGGVALAVRRPASVQVRARALKLEVD